jgi:hypothetical protein
MMGYPSPDAQWKPCITIGGRHLACWDGSAWRKSAAGFAGGAEFVLF